MLRQHGWRRRQPAHATTQPREHCSEKGAAPKLVACSKRKDGVAQPHRASNGAWPSRDPSRDAAANSAAEERGAALDCARSSSSSARSAASASCASACTPLHRSIRRCAAHANMRRGALPWYSRLVLKPKPTGTDRRCRAARRDGNGTGAAASIYLHTCARCASLSACSFGAAAALQRPQCLGDRSSGAHRRHGHCAKSAGGGRGTGRYSEVLHFSASAALPRNAELAGWVRERREERTC